MEPNETVSLAIANHHFVTRLRLIYSVDAVNEHFDKVIVVDIVHNKRLHTLQSHALAWTTLNDFPSTSWQIWKSNDEMSDASFRRLIARFAWESTSLKYEYKFFRKVKDSIRLHLITSNVLISNQSISNNIFDIRVKRTKSWNTPTPLTIQLLCRVFLLGQADLQ